MGAEARGLAPGTPVGGTLEGIQEDASQWCMGQAARCSVYVCARVQHMGRKMEGLGAEGEDTVFVQIIFIE